MNFLLQFRDAESDQPLLEVRSPLPLQPPARGESVKLLDPAGKEITGRVDQVMWLYQPLEADPQHDPSLDIIARVWLGKNA